MGDAVGVFLLTLSALFPIVDPLAGRPIFLAVTQSVKKSESAAVNNLASMLVLERNLNEGRRMFDQALQLAREMGDE